MCENKELLVGYLYDDVTSEERRAFEAHLASCAECRNDVTALRSTRDHLATWTPPEAELGFRIVRQTAEPPAKVVPFQSRWMPAFGLAAAAVLVLAAASALANIEVRYDNDGFVVRTGWARSERAAPAVAPAQSASGSTALTAGWRADFDTLERRLRDIEATVRTQPSNGVQLAASGSRMTDAEILRRVREIVREAESRQDVAVAQRLLQVMQDFQRERRADLAMLQQDSAQYHGATQAQLLKLSEQLRVNQLEK